jgi:ferredoxin--NADP+ reductase
MALGDEPLKALARRDPAGGSRRDWPAGHMKSAPRPRSPSALHSVVSLNTIMVDGTGMCGGCRVAVGGKTKFVCVDGPEFDGHQVDFDSMIRRLSSYKTEEAAHACRLSAAAEKLVAVTAQGGK